MAVVEVTIGRFVATLARRLEATTGSLGLTIASSFSGVGGCSSVTDWASRDDW